MKANHLMVSAVAAAGLIFSAGVQAGGLAGGLGGGVGGALGGGFASGMGNFGGGLRGGAMNSGFGADAIGNGSMSATSNGLGRAKREAGNAKSATASDAAHGKESATLGVASAKQVAADDVGHSPTKPTAASNTKTDNSKQPSTSASPPRPAASVKGNADFDASATTSP